jgi:hypothetical protein
MAMGRRVGGIPHQRKGNPSPCVVTSGLVCEATKPWFVEVLQQAVRLHDSRVAAGVMAVLAVLLAWRFRGQEEHCTRTRCHGP